MDCFSSFDDLQEHASEGMDYTVAVRQANSGLTIMAPHGGGIEPGTATIADAIAGDQHSYFAFRGIRINGNAALHLASDRFDEPRALKLINKSHTVMTVHGCRGGSASVLVGGL